MTNTQTDTLVREATTRYQQGDWGGAQAALAEAIASNPGSFEAQHVMGVVCVALCQRDEARQAFQRALRINPESSLAHFNLATLLSEGGDDALAIPHHWAAVKLSPDNQDAWINFGRCLFSMKKYDDALKCFEQALDIEPDHAEALGNQGGVYIALGRHEEALQALEKALAINADVLMFWLSRSRTLIALGRHEEAIDCLDRALILTPETPTILYAKGNALNELKRYDQALEYYDRAIQRYPDLDYVHENRISTQMHLCEWSGVGDRLRDLEQRIRSGKNACTPFTALSVFDDPSLHRQAAEIYGLKFPPDPVLGEIQKRARKDKIRVGYFSHDFHHHATALLTAELFELHDRSRFEVIAFSFGPDRSDPMRRRLQSAFDRFIDVRHDSDAEVAQMARELEIDIAVDLQGYQTQHRTGIFACRAAPIQVNYLAFPGTMGVPYMDYLIADDTIIPSQNQQHYTEKIAYLPHTYQVNDRQRPIAQRQFLREALGLPADGFVFCCFNHQYKITPQVFESWMRIVSAVNGSVLWLFENSELATQHLRAAAEKQGVAGNRLVFARQMALPDHLARHRCADLFLDTHPYNAHTTASDALWAGLPVLTQQSDAMAGRVAASLLKAVNLPEMIVQTSEEYESLAIELAMRPLNLEEIKSRLETGRHSAPLFDTPLFTKNLEILYEKMIDRYQADLLPEHLLAPYPTA